MLTDALVALVVVAMVVYVWVVQPLRWFVARKRHLPDAWIW